MFGMNFYIISLKSMANMLLFLISNRVLKTKRVNKTITELIAVLYEVPLPPKFSPLNFVNGALNFVNGAFNFVNGAFNFVNGAFNFVNGTFYFVNGALNFVNGAFYFKKWCLDFRKWCL